MTIIVEFGPPFQWKPGTFKSRVMYRVWFAWLAVSWLRIPLKELAETAFDWRHY